MSSYTYEHEKVLLLDVANGNEAAFVVIYNKYKDSIYYAATKLTQSSSLAEEIIQNVFLKLWIRREKLSEIENLRAYLHTMAENLIYDAVKKQQREKIVGKFESEEMVDLTPFALLEQKDYDNILKSAVDRLPPKQKETYLLIKEQSLKRAEAAAILNVSPETVKWNLDQAMRSIRAHCLKQMGVTIGIISILKIYF
jgi:RNA polymerase sigma-70 factor (ECF subfamily)